ncbi:MAG: hemolysin III family protein [Oscillospiraceae bacterium]|jgi:hemolysin III|nr:hemolysin III family protein [Oscillospiraceae bacterium]
MKKSLIPSYSVGEEIFNSITHGVGALCSIVGCVILIIKAALGGGAVAIASAAIYGASLIILYTMSTLYHSLTNEAAKRIFRIFDHCTIFLLIAGTYTPYLLLTLGNTWGLVIFCILWGMTILGMILNAVNLERFKRFSMICYIVMGWCIVIVIKPVILALGTTGTILLVAGGVLYTVGILFYRQKHKKYMHSIWHIFVFTASLLHYLSVLFYVIP